MIELAEIISKNEDKIRAEWIKDMAASVQRADLITKDELDEQSRSLLSAVVAGVRISGPADLTGSGWNTARELLQEISVSRARQGFSPSEVATFVLSLKQPLFTAIRRTFSGKQDQMFEMVWTATELLDRLALLTNDAFIAAREEL